jgi:flavin reductase (DIM6/NTAB) family NADH-FMN oxidoreductase RutF
VTEWMLEQLWAPITALTAAHAGRPNGLIASSALAASLPPAPPRVSVQLARVSLTHELVLASGAFALHLLAADDSGMHLFRSLGFRTGRDIEKLAEVASRAGTTGAPVLADALAFVEARVVQTLPADEVTIVLGDVVTGARLRDGRHLTIEDVRERLSPEDWAAWEARREQELRDTRRVRLS